MALATFCEFCQRDWTNPFACIVELRSRYQRVKYCPACRMQLTDKEAKLIERRREVTHA